MPKITLLTGGVRSGKSSLALEMANRSPGKKAFIATAVAIDPEMKQRIEKHRESRGRNFTTIEEPYDLARALSCLDASVSTVVIDCLTVWLGNLFFKYSENEKQVLEQVELFKKSLEKSSHDCIIVTNETGWGIVPENELSRKFRDVAGYVNQAIARIADEVFLLCSGIPMQIKGEKGLK
jgi:adenosylcobinamide kinase / adenosylcobinamide-phosphate guanylyltransferase